MGSQEERRRHHSAPPKTVNQEAEALVYGPREESYSHPIVDFTTTANMWSALIKSHTGQEVELDAEMVAILMAALKLSRLSRNPTHRDSIIDVCGYMATYERVLQARDEETPGWALRDVPMPLTAEENELRIQEEEEWPFEMTVQEIPITRGPKGPRVSRGSVWVSVEQDHNTIETDTSPPFQGEFGDIDVFADIDVEESLRNQNG